jgi:Spy/CpxP family protein refolding chaperone
MGERRKVGEVQEARHSSTGWVPSEYESRNTSPEWNEDPPMISKNITKQLAIATGLLALTFAPAITQAQSNAQQQSQEQGQSQAAPATPQQQSKRQSVMQGLNLTDDQKTQFKKIHETTKSQVETVKNDSSLSFDQKTAKIRELRHTARMQMVKLLTPDQRAQMKANIRELRAARHEKQQQQAPQAQPQG